LETEHRADRAFAVAGRSALPEGGEHGKRSHDAVDEAARAVTEASEVLQRLSFRLQAMAGQSRSLGGPFGAVIVGLIALGLAGFALWRLFEGATDADRG
jgi:hypothetical protein